MTRDSLHNIQSYYQDFQHVFQTNLTPRILVTWSLWHFSHIYVYVNEKWVVLNKIVISIKNRIFTQSNEILKLFDVLTNHIWNSKLEFFKNATFNFTSTFPILFLVIFIRNSRKMDVFDKNQPWIWSHIKNVENFWLKLKSENSHFKFKIHNYSFKNTIWLSNQRFEHFRLYFLQRFYPKIEKNWRFWSKINV